jgi:tetratricopeptide (TPR) repeat protein
MEPLSSFGISLAASYAIDIIKYIGKPAILTQIKRAFEKALLVYCPNSQIRESERNNLKGIIQVLQDNPSTVISEKTEVLKGTAKFFVLFEQQLAAQDQAYNFIKGVRDAQSFRMVLSSINEVKEEIVEQFKKAQSSSPELEAEYTRQLIQYESNLERFRPMTAFDNLLALESSFASYNFTPNNSIKSNLEYLKAKSMVFNLKKSDEAYKAFIRAYNLDSSLIKVKESACFSYFQIEEFEKAEMIAVEILEVDEFNGVAWAVKTMIAPNNILKNALLGVPKVVLKSIIFKRLVFLSLRLGDRYTDLHEAFDEYCIWVDVDYFDGSLTNYSNFHERLFIIESSISLFSRTMFVSYDELKADSKRLNSLIALLDSFLDAIKGSEIVGNFEGVGFYRSYLQYILDKNPQSVHKMKEHYDSLGKKDSIKLLLLANALQIIGELDAAIEVLVSQKEKSEQSLSLEIVCWSKKEDHAKVAMRAHEFLAKISSVHQHNLDFLFVVSETLRGIAKLKEFDVTEFTKNKEFSDKYILLLIQEFVKVQKNCVDGSTLENLNLVFNDIGDDSTSCRNHLALTYHLMNEHKLAVKVYETFVSSVEETEELFKYMVSLFHTKDRRSELLSLLEHWRHSFSFQPQLLKMELQFRVSLFDFETSLEICKKYLDQDESDEFILANYAIAISHIENVPNNNVNRLIKLAKVIDFEIFGCANHVGEVLIKKGYSVEALEIYFSQALKGISGAKQAYFMVALKMPESILRSLDEVCVGSYVEYEIDGLSTTVEVRKETEKLDQILGKRVGDNIVVSGKFGLSNTIVIQRIMNQYLWLYLEIMKEVKTNPFSDLPMESHNLSDYMGEGKSIFDFFKKLGGNEGYDRNEFLREYHEGKLSFTDITSSVYNNNYVRAFYDLQFEQKGIVEIPATHYCVHQMSYYDYFILDFTSLLSLFQLTRTGVIVPKTKFYLARGILHEIRSFKHEGLFISGSGYVIDEQFYDDLINWIDEYCDLPVSMSILNILANAPDDHKSDPMVNYFMGNASLMMDSEKSLLVTDDGHYARVFPTNSGKLVSSRLFLNHCTLIGLIEIKQKSI